MNHFKKVGANFIPAISFFLFFLVFLIIIKTGFVIVNQSLTYSNTLSITRVIKWSLLYDSLCILLTIFFLPVVINLLRKEKIIIITSYVLCIPVAVMIALNIFDIFYFPFHLQRLDADILHVLRNPFKAGGIYLAICSLIVFIFFLLIVAISFIVRRWKNQPPSASVFASSLYLVAGIIMLNNNITVPTTPLLQLTSKELPVSQNSLHTFIYSAIRSNGGSFYKFNYMDADVAKKKFPIVKNNAIKSGGSNVMLFIMESAAFDFFDKQSKYKVTMPFLDSIVQRSNFFSNAFCFSRTSNKSITAILSGVPTLTDNPLYHSSYSTLQKTEMGKELESNGYRSYFFVGDNYDGFGLAKLSNWLGFTKYYCADDLENYRTAQKHPLGVQDEYIFSLISKVADTISTPFLITNFNTSTHFPYTLPTDFKLPSYAKSYTSAMKSMVYYDYCLSELFKKFRAKSWFNNTVFIFCADHWMYPDDNKQTANPNKTFRIPIFIYDPQNPTYKNIKTPASQFDVLNTILYYTSVNKSFISYGENLEALGEFQNRVVVTKENENLYQGYDSSYVVGFNIQKNEKEFAYNYKVDPECKINIAKKVDIQEVENIEENVKAFLQVSGKHYLSKKIN